MTTKIKSPTEVAFLTAPVRVWPKSRQHVICFVCLSDPNGCSWHGRQLVHVLDRKSTQLQVKNLPGFPQQVNILHHQGEPARLQGPQALHARNKSTLFEALRVFLCLHFPNVPCTQTCLPTWYQVRFLSIFGGKGAVPGTVPLHPLGGTSQ